MTYVISAVLGRGSIGLVFVIFFSARKKIKTGKGQPLVPKSGDEHLIAWRYTLIKSDINSGHGQNTSVLIRVSCGGQYFILKSSYLFSIGS